jgi:hypothetical protein
MKRIFILAALALFFSLSVGAQIPHIYNAYFTIGKLSPGTNDTTNVQVLAWGGMGTPSGVAAYEQMDVTNGMIVWYNCDRYVVVGYVPGVAPLFEFNIRLVPESGPYDEPLGEGIRVWIVEEVVSEGGNVVAPVPPTSELTQYGTYPQAANCISAYYAKKNAWSAEAGLSYDFRNLSVNTSGGLYVANDSVQVEPRGLHGYMLNQMGATTGQALAWDGTNWQPATISGGGGGSQNLSLSGQSLGISGGTGVTLPVVGITAGTNVTTSSAAGVVTINASTPTTTVLDAGSIGDQSNWNPSGYTANTRHIKVQPQTGVTSITGLVPLASGVFQITLENTGQYYCIITHEDAGSTAANRFTLDAPFVALRPGGSITLSYVTDRWEVISSGQPRKTRYTNEVSAAVRAISAPAVLDNFSFTNSSGAGSGSGAGSTMPVGYANIGTSTSAAGRYAYHAIANPYFTDKAEVSYFRAVAQPNTAAPDGTDSYAITIGYTASVDLSTSPKTAAFVCGVSGSTYCGITLPNTNWQCITYDGSGTAESFDTGIAPPYSGTVNSTNLREFTVSITDAGVRYWVDGVLQATHSTETIFNNAMIPAVAIDKTLGTTSRTCAVAALEVYYNDNF